LSQPATYILLPYRRSSDLTIGRVFVPVDQIRAQMADFSAHGLGHRIPLSETSGELRSLAETVNSTLDKLEDARVRERRFVSDARSEEHTSELQSRENLVCR